MDRLTCAIAYELAAILEQVMNNSSNNNNNSSSSYNTTKNSYSTTNSRIATISTTASRTTTGIKQNSNTQYQEIIALYEEAFQGYQHQYDLIKKDLEQCNNKNRYVYPTSNMQDIDLIQSNPRKNTIINYNNIYKTNNSNTNDIDNNTDKKQNELNELQDLINDSLELYKHAVMRASI